MQKNGKPERKHHSAFRIGKGVGDDLTEDFAAGAVGGAILGFIIAYIIAGFVVGLVVLVIAVCVGAGMILFKQRRGLHSKKTENGVFVYASSKRL